MLQLKLPPSDAARHAGQGFTILCTNLDLRVQPVAARCAVFKSADEMPAAFRHFCSAKRCSARTASLSASCIVDWMFGDRSCDRSLRKAHWPVAKDTGQFAVLPRSTAAGNRCCRHWPQKAHTRSLLSMDHCKPQCMFAATRQVAAVNELRREAGVASETTTLTLRGFNRALKISQACKRARFSDPRVCPYRPPPSRCKHAWPVTLDVAHIVSAGCNGPRWHGRLPAMGAALPLSPAMILIGVTPLAHCFILIVQDGLGNCSAGCRVQQCAGPAPADPLCCQGLRGGARAAQAGLPGPQHRSEREPAAAERWPCLGPPGARHPRWRDPRPPPACRRHRRWPLWRLRGRGEATGLGGPGLPSITPRPSGGGGGGGDRSRV